MLRKLLWMMAWLSIGFWSLFAWMAHTAGSMFAWLVTSNRVEGFPDPPFSFEWLIDRIGNAASAGTVLVWLLGCLFIYGVTKVIDWLVFRPDPQQLPQQWR